MPLPRPRWESPFYGEQDLDLPLDLPEEGSGWPQEALQRPPPAQMAPPAAAPVPGAPASPPPAAPMAPPAAPAAPPAPDLPGSGYFRSRYGWPAGAGAPDLARAQEEERKIWGENLQQMPAVTAAALFTHRQPQELAYGLLRPPDLGVKQVQERQKAATEEMGLAEKQLTTEGQLIQRAVLMESMDPASPRSIAIVRGARKMSPEAASLFQEGAHSAFDVQQWLAGVAPAVEMEAKQATAARERTGAKKTEQEIEANVPGGPNAQAISAEIRTIHPGFPLTGKESPADLQKIAENLRAGQVAQAQLAWAQAQWHWEENAKGAFGKFRAARNAEGQRVGDPETQRRVAQAATYAEQAVSHARALVNMMDQGQGLKIIGSVDPEAGAVNAAFRAKLGQLEEALRGASSIQGGRGLNEFKENLLHLRVPTGNPLERNVVARAKLAQLISMLQKDTLTELRNAGLEIDPAQNRSVGVQNRTFSADWERGTPVYQRKR